MFGSLGPRPPLAEGKAGLRGPVTINIHTELCCSRDTGRETDREQEREVRLDARLLYKKKRKLKRNS